MREADFLTSYGEVLEMTVEGNRLIARELAALCRVGWRRVLRSVESMAHSAGPRRHSPRV